MLEHFCKDIHVLYILTESKISPVHNVKDWMMKNMLTILFGIFLSLINLHIYKIQD